MNYYLLEKFSYPEDPIILDLYKGPKNLDVKKLWGEFIQQNSIDKNSKCYEATGIYLEFHGFINSEHQHELQDMFSEWANINHSLERIKYKNVSI